MQFDITYDYLCPFARNANEAVLKGIDEGRDWKVTFRPFSLSQAHVEEGGADVYEDTSASGVLALHWGIAAHFPAAHVALFSARHDDGLDINDEAVIRSALDKAGVDSAAIAEIVATGVPAKTLAEEHTESVERWSVFGVPTFISDEVATFVRFMERGLVSDVDRVPR
jgi:predicted DsbA family dithiol-disulfide isomerase